jgi:LPXTG-motif cell wall-anchored protein
MRRIVYIAALALMAMLVLAPGAMAQQMNHQHMMPNGQMMDDNMMASPSASAGATPRATNNGSTMGGKMMASPSASASSYPSASATSSASAYPSATASTTSASVSPSATTTPSATRGHHQGGGGSSASAAAGGRLPSTGGASLATLVSVGAVALLVGFGLVAARLLRRNH